MRRAFFFLVLFAALAASVYAHEVRPAYLQVHQTGPDIYDIFWKVPAIGKNMRLSLYMQLPEQ